MPAYTQFWHPEDGAATITGLTDLFDPNYYAGQSRDEGFATGDLLRLTGDSLNISMTSWDAGHAYDPDSNAPKPRVTFTGIEQVYGSNGDDVFRASQITEALDGWRGVSFFGGAGNDDFVGSRFDDFIDPGDGDDMVRAGDGNDHVDASRGTDTVYGGGGQDNIRWGGGNAAWLAPGDDVLAGGDGSDLVNLWAYYGDGDGAQGTEVAISVIREDGAMTGTGTVQVDEAGNTNTASFRGFEQGWTHLGHDTIDASSAEVRGDAGIMWNARWGEDVLIGSVGNDTLEGGLGADTLQGGAGDDLIVAGEEWYNPHAPGDGDSDTIIFREGDGNDTVSGFDAGVDVLDLCGANYAVVATNEGALVTLDSGDTILLAGVEDWGLL